MTPMVSRIIQPLKHILSASLTVSRRKPHSPLLTDAEILDILHRVQGKYRSIQHHRDIAHKKTGDMRSLFRGVGMDYEESRRYQGGDDPRYMNWQLSARTGQHYMKVFREERQPGVFLLIDRRSTMRFGTQARLKITQAARIATAVALMSQQANIPVGGVILSHELKWFKENRNKSSLFHFIHQIIRPAKPVFNKNNKNETTLSEVLTQLNNILTSGSIIYLISDFHDIDESYQATLLQMASQHQVHAIQVIDPAEIHLPNAGTLKLVASNMNTVTAMNSDLDTEHRAYTAEANNYFLKHRELFKKLAITHQEVLTTTTDIEQSIRF